MPAGSKYERELVAKGAMIVAIQRRQAAVESTSWHQHRTFWVLCVIGLLLFFVASSTARDLASKANGPKNAVATGTIVISVVAVGISTLAFLRSAMPDRALRHAAECSPSEAAELIGFLAIPKSGRVEVTAQGRKAVDAYLARGTSGS